MPYELIKNSDLHCVITYKVYIRSTAIYISDNLESTLQLHTLVASLPGITKEEKDTVEQTDIYTCTYQYEIDVHRSDETINLRNPV